MPTPEEVKEGVRMFQEELERNADAIAEVIGTDYLKLGEPVYVSTRYEYSIPVGPIAVDAYSFAKYRITDVIIEVTDDDIDVSLRGVKLKKDGTPDPRAGGNQFIGDHELGEKYKAAFRKSVGMPDEEGGQDG